MSLEVKENMAVEGGGLNKSHSKQLVDFSLEASFCGIESVSMTGRLTSEPLAKQRTWFGNMTHVQKAVGAISMSVRERQLYIYIIAYNETYNVIIE